MTSRDPEYPLGRRISVTGKGGKTTLSKALAKRFDLEFIEQDAIRHQANWVELSNEEHREVLGRLMDDADGAFVVDGNYSAVRDMLLPRVETLIVLALPWRVMFWRTLKRTVLRRIRGEELWNGNTETFRSAFLTYSIDSVVWDLWIRRKRYRRFAADAEEQRPDHVRLIIIRSGKELNEFYEEHGLVRD